MHPRSPKFCSTVTRFCGRPGPNPRRSAVGGWRVIGIGLLGALAAGAAGCQTPPQPSGQTERVLHVVDYEQFLDDSLSLLRRCDFAPAYVDRSRGLIISKPATSGQWFEFWRVDSAGGYQKLESSLHTMRRVVTVRVEPVDVGGPTMPASSPATRPAATQPAVEHAPGPYRVAVEVEKSRYSAPERQVTTASGALAIYSERLPTTEGLRGARSRHDAWVPLGRDGSLEGLLLQRLAGLPSADVGHE